eukprot:scaffold200748_cov27-Prasinocladus_malaysianus.AAC.1
MRETCCKDKHTAAVETCNRKVSHEHMQSLVFVTLQVKPRRLHGIKRIIRALCSVLQILHVLTERCGTAHFMAPEVVRRQYGPECDIWSAGVTAYLLLCGHVPFAADDVRDFDEEAVLERVLSEDLDTESGDWTYVSDGAKDFVRSLLQRDPRKRP